MKIQYPLWLLQQEAVQQGSKIDPKDKFINNFDQQSEKLFSQISIGFGKEEAYLVHCAVKKLA